MIYSVSLAVVIPYLKGLLISEILSILHARGLAKFTYKSQVVALESFLEVIKTSNRFL